MVRCRQECTDKFPVPYGYKECTGCYEGDTCTVHCDEEYKLQGDSKKVVCGKMKMQSQLQPNLKV